MSRNDHPRFPRTKRKSLLPARLVTFGGLRELGKFPHFPWRTKNFCHIDLSVDSDIFNNLTILSFCVPLILNLQPLVEAQYYM